MLIVVSPAGLEGFFHELAAADRAGELRPGAYARASQRYGIIWLSGDQSAEHRDRSS